MNFLDNETYGFISQININNRKISLLNYELKQYTSKKKNNEYFLLVQQDEFNKTYTKRNGILRKYYHKIVKSIIIMNNNKKDNKEIQLKMVLNNKLIEFFQNKLQLFNCTKTSELECKYHKLFEQINNKKYKINNNQLTNHIVSKLDIKKINNNLLSYLIYYNGIEETNINYLNINKKCIYIKQLNEEFKLYYKQYSNIHKEINKLRINNIKYNKIIIKNNKQNELLYKKSIDLSNHYKSNFNYIKNQEIKNIRTKLNFLKNICDLNNRINWCKQNIQKYSTEVNSLEEELEKVNKRYGTPFHDDSQCVICLDDIKYGVITKCNHSFHYSCINLYIYKLLNNNTKIEIKCPICRQFI